MAAVAASEATMAVRIENPKDAHAVAAALLRLADTVDERGKVAYLDEVRRGVLAGQLREMADSLDPDGRVFGVIPAMYTDCPACNRKVRVNLLGAMRCECGRSWEFGLRPIAAELSDRATARS